MTTETTGRTPDQEQRIARARARLRAAELRVHACQNDAQVAGYNRQALTPLYAGQEAVCAGKAAEGAAYAAQTRAQADLVEAEAGI